MMEKVGVILLLLLTALLDVHGDLDLPDTSQWLNIDCGASAIASVDSFLVWFPDDSYIKTGQKTLVSQDKEPHAMNTLRFFPEGDENCYTLPGPGNNRVLLRAGFYYGNYDGISKPPTFDLQFDGHRWATVETSLDEDPIYHEVVYRPLGGSISVCLVRRGDDDGGVPFISSLELMPFPADMYTELDANMGFYLRSRVDFGGIQDVRFNILDEQYNRIWKAKGMPDYLNESSLPDKSPTAKNYPPLQVIETAITAYNSSDSLALLIDLPPTNQTAYIILYFKELVLFPDPINGRKFTIYINGQGSNKIVQLKNNTCQVVSLHPIEFSGPANLTLSPLEVSTLPPIINAMEVFTTIDLDQDAGAPGASGAPGGNGHFNPFYKNDSEPSSMFLVPVILILGVVTLLL